MPVIQPLLTRRGYRRAMIRLAALLTIFWVTEAAAAPPAPTAFVYNIRVSLQGETLMDQDMVWMPPYTGQSYSREWSSYVGDACVPNERRAVSATRSISVHLRAPRAPLHTPSVHAFVLQISTRLPMTLRGRDGACAPNPAGNETRLTQMVNLDPGQSVRIESDEHLLVEVMRP